MTAPANTDAETSPGWGTKALILAGGPAVALSISGITAALPRIEQALAHTDQDRMLVKMLVGIVGVAAVVGPPLTGFLSDRIGLKRVLVGLYALFTLAGVAGMFLNDLAALAAARFLCGLAGAGAVTASIIIINKRLAPARRPAWFGAYIAVASVAAIIVQPIAGLLADAGWNRVFAIYLFGLPVTIITLVAFTDSPRDRTGPADTGRQQAEMPLRAWFPWRHALLGFLMGAIVYLPLIYVPFLLRDMGVQSTSEVAMVLTVEAVATALLAFLYGWSRRFLSEKGAFALAFLATGLGSAVAGLAPDYTTIMAGLAIAGLGVGWFMPNLMTALGNSVEPHQQGRAAGFVKATNYLATPICVLAAEPLFRLYGARAPIVVAAGIAACLLLLVLYQLLRQRTATIAEA